MLLASVQVSLASDEQDRLENRLSTAKMAEEIYHIRIDSSLGMDGLQAEFYQLDPET